MVWTPEKMDERTEGELRGTLTKIAESVGIEAYMDMTTKIVLANEAYLRAHAAPDNPALKLLDEYYAKKERGFE